MTTPLSFIFHPTHRTHKKGCLPTKHLCHRRFRLLLSSTSTAFTCASRTHIKSSVHHHNSNTLLSSPASPYITTTPIPLSSHEERPDMDPKADAAGCLKNGHPVDHPSLFLRHACRSFSPSLAVPPTRCTPQSRYFQEARELHHVSLSTMPPLRPCPVGFPPSHVILSFVPAAAVLGAFGLCYWSPALTGDVEDDLSSSSITFVQDNPRGRTQKTKNQAIRKHREFEGGQQTSRRSR